MKRVSSHALTRLAFGAIIVFVLAQVLWWVVFQRRYVDEVTQAALAQWRQDEQAVTVLYRAHPDLLSELLARYPQLRFDAESQRFVVRDEVVAEFMARQQRHVRMFAYEGPFFIFVILVGLYIIAASLRSERDIKRRQQNFLSAITHEFKTPLSTMRLLIETALMRSLPPEKQRDYLKRMAGELARLEHTSEQVLAAARLEHAKEPPPLEPLELNSVIQGIVGRARAGLEARGATLKVSYSPEPILVSLDKDAFSVVINNLLDNAVKYSPGGERPVWVRLERQGDLALIHIEDAGVGIPEDERDSIFERFYRVGSEMTRASQGVGLGLYLVKSITEAMNGWVRVEANEPRGSRFTVVLPRRLLPTPEERELLRLETAGDAA